MSKLESLAGQAGPSRLGSGNPYETDIFEEAGQQFDQQMQTIENAFEEPVFEEVMPYSLGMFNEQQDMFIEQLPDENLPQENLEQIVEHEAMFTSPAFTEQDMMHSEIGMDMNIHGTVPDSSGYDADMIADEINQAIDSVTQGPMDIEDEPYPFQQDYDPYMMGQNMFGQPQYMPNPFGMPGSMGPMGPIPGP